MVEAARHIVQETQGGAKEFEADGVLQAAVLHWFHIIGEAAKRVQPETQALAPDIPWRRLADFRNIVAHEYHRIDLGMVWKAVQQNPRLLERLESLLEKVQGQ